MDAIEYLSNDHRKVETIFQRLEEGVGLSEAKSLFSQLYQELSLHALAEENVFYPALARFPEMSHLLKDAFKEHSEMKAAFGELAALPVSSTEWSDKMGKLIKDVKHHVREEESQIFPKARQLFSTADLQAMAGELQKAKDLSTRAVENSLPMMEINMGAGNVAQL